MYLLAHAAFWQRAGTIHTNINYDAAYDAPPFIVVFKVSKKNKTLECYG